MDNLEIYYFSGTGNCLATAKQIAAAFDGAKVLAMGALFKKGEPVVISSKQVLFIFPSYAYEMPKFVARFIKKAEINSEFIGAVCTFGSKPGEVFFELKRILKRKKLKLNYCAGVKSVENYIPMFNVPKQEKIDKLIVSQRETTESVISDLKNKIENKPKRVFFGTIIVGKVFRTVRGCFAKFYRVTKDCNGCSMCQRLCPSNAIKIKNGKPKFSTKCEHCQGCLNFCPKKAIRYIHYSPKSRRYTHPDVKINELNQ